LHWGRLSIPQRLVDVQAHHLPERVLALLRLEGGEQLLLRWNVH
jgi:hypothetical protein